MYREAREIDPNVISTLCSNLHPYNHIRAELFHRYGVERGLRNADGTGVLAGITRLSNVHGYLLNEGEREPIQGRLTYRGIDLYNLLYGFESENRFGFGEPAFLLLSGKLPTAQQLHDFRMPSAKTTRTPR